MIQAATTFAGRPEDAFADDCTSVALAVVRTDAIGIVDPLAGVIEVHRLEAGGYVLAQRASGDDGVRSAVLGGASLRAAQIFP